MRILHVASEIFPLIKTGGLADVVGALPPALVKYGLDVRVLIPGFPEVLNRLALSLELAANIGPLFGAATVKLHIARLPHSGVPVYVVDAPFLYRRDGNPYVGPDGQDWNDNHRRFALLGWCAAHIASGELDPHWVPEIVHAHDWHAGLTPAYIRQNPALKTRTVFTIHNMAFRGLFPTEYYSELDLPLSKLGPDGMEFHGKISFMKSGLVYSDKVTTVSPTYAHEICTPEFGCGLEGVIQQRRADLSGILNGVDYDIWNPCNPLIAEPYSVDELHGKHACKKALQQEFGLSSTAPGPLFAVVSRLTPQKGMDLLLGALPDLLKDGGQLVILGAGDHDLELGFRQAALDNPENVGVYIGYDEEMSHRIMAGADVFLVPSRFEPCGLTQLYALRYGTLPLVRRVGGLADTVFDMRSEYIQTGRTTGFVFDEISRYALGAAIHEACELYRQDERLWTEIQRRGMRENFSWQAAAASYAELYWGLLSR